MGRGYNNSFNSSSLKVTSSVNKIKLKQLGAELQRIDSKIYHVTFKVNDIKLEYFYNINESGKFFLERMKPYYKNFRVFTDENDAIRAIYEDVEYFRNASKSHNFGKFLEMSVEMEKLHDAYAEMFLHHNVPEDSLVRIETHILEAKQRINELNSTTEEIKLDCSLENE